MSVTPVTPWLAYRVDRGVEARKGPLAQAPRGHRRDSPSFVRSPEGVSRPPPWRCVLPPRLRCAAALPRLRPSWNGD